MKQRALSIPLLVLIFFQIISCAPSYHVVDTLELNEEKLTLFEVDNFFPIQDSKEDVSLNFIGTISATVTNKDRSTLPIAFEGLRHKAHSYGANLYELKTPKCVELKHPCEIILELYSHSEISQYSEFLAPNNFVYILGGIVYPSKEIDFKFNDKVITVLPLHYWWFEKI